MLEMLLSLVIVPVLIGVFSSFAFLKLLSLMRPSFKISPEIAMYETRKTGKQKGYVIKVINTSRRSAIEVKVRIAIVRNKTVPGGTIMRTTDIPLERDTLFEIPGYEKRSPERSAFRFVTYYDLEHEWSDNESQIMFVLFAKDSLTSFGKVFSKVYYLKRECLKEGSFRHGNSLDII